MFHLTDRGHIQVNVCISSRFLLTKTSLTSLINKLYGKKIINLKFTVAKPKHIFCKNTHLSHENKVLVLTYVYKKIEKIKFWDHELNYNTNVLR